MINKGSDFDERKTEVSWYA